MSNETTTLGQLGWRAFYSQQLTLEELDESFPARVASVHRSHLVVLSESREQHVTLAGRLRPDDGAPDITVGDWVLVHNSTHQIIRVLDRQSLIARMAAGTGRDLQPIASNVDTLFVVTSCNADFNVSRLERYLAVAHEAQVTPVIVLTKVDMCADPMSFISRAQRAAADVAVLSVNATDAPASVEALRPWLGSGQTIAFVGSSGVGKSTLINSVLGASEQDTAGIRESDSRGRHTTVARYLLQAPSGAWLIDTPGMRELKIGAAAAGLERAFMDIEDLAAHCRFRDCSHQGEAVCAVRAAVEDGRLDERRLQNYLKLAREVLRAAIPPWELRQSVRRGGRLARAAQKRRRREKGTE